MFKSIRSRLISTAIGFAIIPLLIVGVVLATRTFSVQYRQGAQVQNQTALRVATELRSFIQQLESQLTLLIRLKSLNKMNRQEQKDALMEIMAYQQLFEELILTDKFGYERVRVHQHDIFLDQELVNRSETPEFKIPSQKQKTYFGPVEFNAFTGEPLMLISKPVYDLRTGNINGVLIGNARLKKIWMLLANIEVQKNERIYILDLKNRVIAHPNPSVVLRNTRFDIFGEENSLIRKGLFGDNVLLVFQTVKFGGQLFSIVVERDVQEVFELAFNTIFIITALIVISLLMAVGMIMLLLHNVIRPIHTLSLVANEIEQGNLDKRAEIHREDEIGVLSKSFNRMTQRLKDSMSHLEHEYREKEKSELEIRRLQQTLANIIDSMPSVLIGVNAKGIITHWNQEAVNFSGIEREQALKKSLKNTLPDLPDITPRIKDSILSATTYSIEKVQLKLAEQELIFNITIFPLISEEEIGGAVIRIDDITELARKDEQLKQAQKMESIGTLAGGLAHDFNNILQPILGYTNLLSKKIEGDEKCIKYITQIHKASLRAKELVQHILTFSRQSELDLTPIKLQSIIKEVSILIRASLPTTIAISQEIDEHCGHIMGNSTQIHQILLNLATNAYHAMQDQNGELKISLHSEVIINQQAEFEIPPGQYACLKVADNGTGMEPEVLSKAFDPYFTTKESGKGTGLGLSVVRGIIKGHSGFVHVSSLVDQGTTFRIYFPIVENLDESAILKTEEIDPVGTESILLVDDELPILQLVKEILENLGYKTETQISSIEALKRILDDKNQFDLVLTDMTMPKMTGETLAQKALEKRPELPIIMCTGYSELIDERKARKIGIKAFIKKPFTQNVLSRTVRKVLDENLTHSST